MGRAKKIASTPPAAVMPGMNSSERDPVESPVSTSSSLSTVIEAFGRREAECNVLLTCCRLIVEVTALRKVLEGVRLMGFGGSTGTVGK